MLGQMAAGTERAVLNGLNLLFDQVAAPVQERWLGSLRSTEDKKFFQGYSEALSAAFLSRSGWEIVDVCSPKPCIIARHPDGREQRIVTMAFLQTPPDPNQQKSLETLARVVNRADSDRRITILVKRWSTHTFDPEPVRRCIEIWLDAIAKDEWHGRYATFEDDHIHLEFTRTDEPTRAGQGAVPFLLAPQNGMHTLEVVETRLVYELDNLLSASPSNSDILLSLVTNTAWALAPGLLRSLLYGRPAWQVTNGEAQHQRFGFQLGDCPALFQEAPYRRVTAALDVDHPPSRGPCGRAYHNPWANMLLTDDDIACASFQQDRAEDGFRIMKWSESA
jgi:hypothetical protein